MELDFSSDPMTDSTPQQSSSAKDDRDRSAQGGHAEATEPRPSSRLPGLIGLYSPSPGCGKTTVAKALAPYGYERVSFAQPLRDMLTPFLDALGYSENYLSQPWLKESPLHEIGVSPRNLMRTLGTEWGRTCVHPDVWAVLASMRIRKIQHNGGLVVIDDVRFPNEAELIRRHGGQLWLITREESVPASNHASDTSMADWDDFDAEFHNNGTLRCLIDDVADLMEHP
jgi:hypothetical protein